VGVNRPSPPLPPPLVAELEAAYREPHRHYHTLTHVAALRAGLQRHLTLAERPELIDAAIWFHDAVYDTHRDDNEERSAQWAENALGALGWPAAAVERVAAMVRATQRHEAPSGDADTRLFLDLDLGVLGQGPAVYDAYAAQIRAEYAWVDAAAYAQGRATVLRAFRARPAVYFTPALHAAWEDRARENLAREISALDRHADNHAANHPEGSSR
jgi:predicted metal-dependent HD superfamily phosphohydrolase